MATQAQREEQEIALDRVITRIDAQARDDGHVPSRWEIDVDDTDLTAASRCTVCGLDAAARARPDGTVWSAGKMRLEKCGGGDRMKPRVDS